MNSVKSLPLTNEVFSADVAQKLGVNRSIGKLSPGLRYSFSEEETREIQNSFANAEKRGETESAALDELPKSFILYFDNDQEFKICFSQLSTSSLDGRIEEEE